MGVCQAKPDLGMPEAAKEAPKDIVENKITENEKTTERDAAPEQTTPKPEEMKKASRGFEKSKGGSMLFNNDCGGL